MHALPVVLADVMILKRNESYRLVLICDGCGTNSLRPFPSPHSLQSYPHPEKNFVFSTLKNNGLKYNKGKVPPRYPCAYATAANYNVFLDFGNIWSRATSTEKKEVMQP